MQNSFEQIKVKVKVLRKSLKVDNQKEEKVKDSKEKV
jgi:hypothetical protein